MTTLEQPMVAALYFVAAALLGVVLAFVAVGIVSTIA